MESKEIVQKKVQMKEPDCENTPEWKKRNEIAFIAGEKYAILGFPFCMHTHSKSIVHCAPAIHLSVLYFGSVLKCV